MCGVSAIDVIVRECDWKQKLLMPILYVYTFCIEQNVKCQLEGHMKLMKGTKVKTLALHLPKLFSN